MGRYNIKKLKYGEVKQYQVTFRNNFAALKKEYSTDINRTWDNIRENFKISAQESKSKHHKPRFDEECS
jgi:hypothetical protein